MVEILIVTSFLCVKAGAIDVVWHDNQIPMTRQLLPQHLIHASLGHISVTKDDRYKLSFAVFIFSSELRVMKALCCGLLPELYCGDGLSVIYVLIPSFCLLVVSQEELRVLILQPSLVSLSPLFLNDQLLVHLVNGVEDASWRSVSRCVV